MAHFECFYGCYKWFSSSILGKWLSGKRWAPKGIKTIATEENCDHTSDDYL